jgi:hypothetical protein
MVTLARKFKSINFLSLPFVSFVFLFFVSFVFPVTRPDASTWHVYVYRDKGFVAAPPVTRVPARSLVRSCVCPPSDLPSSWAVRAAQPADLNRDGVSECVLLVWRPWQDWPIMRWSTSPSPIVTHRDIAGDSAHIILVAPYSGAQSYRELWAGSALALPVLQFETGDVNGDGWEELVVLEGTYALGRDGPARDVAVWRWNGFGFALDWRSPTEQLVDLSLADLNDDGVSEILVEKLVKSKEVE